MMFFLAIVAYEVYMVTWMLKDDARQRRADKVAAIHKEYANANLTYARNGEPPPPRMASKLWLAKVKFDLNAVSEPRLVPQEGDGG